MRRVLVVCALWAVGCGEVVKGDDGDAPDAGPTFDVARCFDGVDNESDAGADGLVDCADPRCDDYATCVATTELDGTGVTVDADEPCPAGFEGGETLLHRGLDATFQCEGCGCEVGATTCEASIWLYATSGDCFNDVGLGAGSMLGIAITDQCTMEPIYYSDPGGIRVKITPNPTCNATGAAAPADPTWAETKKFCLASPSTALGGGCEPAHACVAKVESPASQCVVVDGESDCEGYATAETDWYTGVDDSRSCGACFCQAVGGDCTDTKVQVGNDYSCFDAGNNFASGEKRCYGGGGDRAPYSPPALVLGTPAAPVGCTSAATPAGTAAPTGQTTLCCGPQ